METEQPGKPSGSLKKSTRNSENTSIQMKMEMQNLWDAAKILLRMFSMIQAFLKKQKKISNNLEKDGKNKTQSQQNEGNSKYQRGNID